MIIPNEYTNPKTKFEAKIIEEDNDNLNNENSTFAKPKSIKKKPNDENYYFPFTPPKGIINGYNLKSFDELNSNGSNLQTQTVGLEDEEKIWKKILKLLNKLIIITQLVMISNSRQKNTV